MEWMRCLACKHFLAAYVADCLTGDDVVHIGNIVLLIRFRILLDPITQNLLESPLLIYVLIYILSTPYCRRVKSVYVQRFLII